MDASEDPNRTTMSIVQHLNAIRNGALLLGFVQWLTLAVFFYALLETLGLSLRWLMPPSFLANNYGPSSPVTTYATLYQDVAQTTDMRVRAYFDTFMEMGTVVALNGSRADVRSSLRNLRDHLVEHAVSKEDLLDMLGDTMLKIAFMGTVFGIGTALYYARDLDVADPLLRLTAKSQMYAGIGMGFGATLVGIALSVAAAKFRHALSEAWSRKIDDGWMDASDFFERFPGYSNTFGQAPGGAAAKPLGAGQPPVTLNPPPIIPPGQAAPLIDKLIVGVGVVALLAVLGWLAAFLLQASHL
jgi:hypothetical protein